jgi:hypothetical protein
VSGWQVVATTGIICATVAFCFSIWAVFTDAERERRRERRSQTHPPAEQGS